MFGIWEGVYVFHLVRNTWAEFPMFITFFVVSVLGVGLIVFGIVKLIVNYIEG
jgi:hypothetical protein